MALMNALSSAVSGINSSQSGLDATANNIANVNTPGYKAQTVSFSDLLSQTVRSASGATTTTGGINPSQIGLGVQVASIDSDMTVGTASTTSKSTDVALTGDGYLVVQTTTKGDHQYTRNGNLKIDEDGNLNIDGYEVCGWEKYTLDSEGNKVYTTTGAVEPINVYSDAYSGSKKVMDAKTTTKADVSGYLSSSADVVTGATLKNIGSSPSKWDTTTTVDVVDEQGNKTEVTLNLKKCATQNSTTTWYWEASATDTAISPSSGYIAFDSNGDMVTSVTPLTSSVTSNTNTKSDLDTFKDAIDTATGGTASTNKTAVADAYTAYANALAAGGATTTTAGTIVSTKTTLDNAISTLADATLSSALTKYSTASGTAINTAATTEKTTDNTANQTAVTDAIANAKSTAIGTGYSVSNVSVTSSLTAGSYTVSVAAATTGSGYTVTLTDPAGKNYETTSTDGSATFKTSSGTVTLTAPTTIRTGTMKFDVTAGTAETFDSIPTITVASTTNATNAVPVKLDLSAITCTGTSTSKLNVDEDGYEAGSFSGSYTIGTDGTISASYSNGKTQSIGQIALAVFENANGLEKVGNNLYAATTNSGDYNFVVAGENGSGVMRSNALELSNVDLAAQFSSMMISQRAYQANTKIVSTASDMLQSLINMVG